MNRAFVVLICLTFCLLVAASPQQTAEEADSTSQGVALYEGGETEGAIRVLREAVKKSKKDPKAWHYLGLALFIRGHLKTAGEALDKAIVLRERAIKLEFDGDEGVWRGDQLLNLKMLLRGQIEGQSKLMEILSDRETRELGKLVLARSRALAECVDEQTQAVGGQQQVTKTDLKMEKARVLFKPPPRYPESARGERVNGTVSLRVIFAADGSVQHIELVRSPDSRLTEEAISAARLIKFTPASICGKPVSYPVQLEYSFNTF